MTFSNFKAILVKSGLATSVLLLASGAAFADSAVTLTAAPTTASLPDGQTVPMWGYTCSAPSGTGVSCTAMSGLAQTGTTWQPPLITVPSGTPLTITLVNSLSFSTNPPTNTTFNSVPTSLVIVGQLGGGLGAPPTTTVSPTHTAQGPTWPAAGPADPGIDPNCVTSSAADAAAAGTNCPPAQPPRVQSFATEVLVSDAGGKALTWNNLRPGTYLLESGTHPSIQGPMGLYGVVVVTDSPQTYPGVAFDKDVALLLSEIDPTQNAAVDKAVRTAGFAETTVWSGLPGKCGDPTPGNAEFGKCYPPAVNYDPRYYLINGGSFDRTNLAAATLTGPGAAATSGTVLLRFVNAGLRMHVPAVVGLDMTLYAEDGNVLPGTPKVQNEVFLPAGKTYDVGVQPTQSAGSYAAGAYPIYDRQLSLSTSNQRDGGMQAYLAVNGGAATSAATLSALDKTYYCVAGRTLSVTDPGKGVLAGATGANGALLGTTFTGLISTANLSLQSNGTFTYTQLPTDTTCGGTFTFLANGNLAAAKTATITQCDVSTPGCAAIGSAPVANIDTYSSKIASQLKINPPGVLENDTDPAGLALKASAPTGIAGGTVTLNPDGSFTVIPACAPSCTAASAVTFSYMAVNSQNTPSAPTTVTVSFTAPTGLVVAVKDIKTGLPINDYRWVIEEDRTFWVDPKCQTNSNTRPASCPPLPVESLGYNFHTANMPVVATGCVGSVSCESGQSIVDATGSHVGAACDIGNGVCRTDATEKIPANPSQVYLDPAKRYYISVLPGDGVNPVIGGAGGPDENGKPFDIQTVCGTYAPDTSLTGTTAWAPGAPGAICGHAMGGAPITPEQVAAGAATTIGISLQQTPLPTSKIAVFVFEDDHPLNGENDAGGGVDVIAVNEPGLGGFEVKLFDQAGGLGDATGQITYDMFNMPVSNSLAGHIDPATGFDACPITKNPDGLVGMIPTCPKYENGNDANGNPVESPLAGQALISNLYPGLYEVVATPAADRIARGEEWLQTNTLDGGKPHEAFIKPNEPGYFQEFGPGGFHVSIGFANPQIINGRKHRSDGTGICDPQIIGPDGTNTGGGGLTCDSSLTVQVSNARMSRTPDQRIYSSGDYNAYGFTQCYLSLGPPDQADFAFAKCDGDGKATFTDIPKGDYKLTIFDQWNDIMLDGLVQSVTVDGSTLTKEFSATQWRTDLYTRTYIDTNNDGVSQDPGDPGLPLVATNIRYRDGSFGFFNNTDMNGYAGFNEVFPFMNWLVVEADTTRYAPTGAHVVYDAGGPADGTPGGGTSTIAAGLANTIEHNSVPSSLRVPGAVYCADADCSAASIASGPYYGGSSGPGGSAGRIDPPWATTEGWQGLLGQSSFIEFGMRPFADGENGGIKGHVIYASTRPFDDPTLLLQLSWEPGVPRVKINLYQEGIAPDGTKSLKLVDTTTTSSWDDWAQGFRTDNVPNMNCPGQPPDSPFFQSLMDSKQWLDPSNPKKALPNHSQFKCFDGWSMLNQVQPAPYDGMYKFPSIASINPATGRPISNCHMSTGPTDPGCVVNPVDGLTMLQAGKYVVEVIVPPGFELVKEEDKNILLGDVYIAPVTQQFAGLGNIFIMPDQAAVNAYYNKDSQFGLNQTTNMGATPRHEGDTGSVESFWPCVGAMRVVPDYNSLFPGAGQNAPFAGASRPLCDRKEVTLENQMTALAKFYVFTNTHIAGHFTGTMTNDFASEFDPFSPQFGEKYSPPNLPIAMRDFTGKEVSRVYADQWGIFNGLYFSSYGVNPPNPTGYVPQMSISCMNDPGPILDSDPASPTYGKMITDPNYSPAYSNFCYEMPFMPGFTAYMDTPVIPTQAFADGYNLPDSSYPDGTPGILRVDATGGTGPWMAANGFVTSVHVDTGGAGYAARPNVTFTPTDGGSGAVASATMNISSTLITNPGSGYTSNDLNGGGGGNGSGVTITGGGGTGALVNAANITLKVVSVRINTAGTCNGGTHNVNFTGGGGNAGGGGTATATAVPATGNGGGSGVTAVNLTNGGGSYTGVPNVNVTGCSESATAIMGIRSISLANGGSGYTSQPTVGIVGPPATCTGTCTGASASALMSVDAVAVTTPGSGYNRPPLVVFNDIGSPAATAAATAVLGFSGTAGLTITSLGTQTVLNPAYSGPNATSAPYNLKKITRNYGFGSGTGAVTVGGVSVPVLSWSPGTITTGPIPAGVPACGIQQRGERYAGCGQLVVTAASGRQSIDAVTVTVGGKPPTVIANENADGNALQLAIDAAAPGDLIIVGPDTYKENLLMWKPVRLQGVGAASVTINADAHPAGKMDPWRRQVNCLFGLSIEGTPDLGNANFDPTGTYTCDPKMFMRSDRLPFEGFVGWDASSNGNLAQVLQEPTLMGAYEGAGVTVLGRGIRVPDGSEDLWGVVGGAGTFPDGSLYLTNSDADCATSTDATLYDYGTANFKCNPSRIDGLTITNSSQGGGAIFIHGWNHNLDVANNRIYGNHGTLSGGINLGNGETPPVYTNDGTICGTTLAPAAQPLCPPIPPGTVADAIIPSALDTDVHVHHNAITDNASIGDALFSGTPSGAGGITISEGADRYQVDHNWISGNMSTGDGGGIVHTGVSFNGRIANNWILFNQSVNPTLPTNGGGITIQGANSDVVLANGNECGTTNDVDCPPGISDGAGPGLVIDANLIMGNSAESGSGGGLRLQQINGSEVAAFPCGPNPKGVTTGGTACGRPASPGWFDITITNNIIANNVAGWDGAGVSMQDALKVSFINNTVSSNDTTGSAGVLFKTIGSAFAASPPPGCDPGVDPTGSCYDPNAPSHNQPAGLVSMMNTPSLVRALPNTTPAGTQFICPTGFGYTTNDGNCKVLSRPLIRNDLFWQNRAFHIVVGGAGTGLQSQQNLVTLLPALNQTATGACTTGAIFWDIGVRSNATGPTVAGTDSIIVLINQGLGYTSQPAVSITGGGGTGATAVAVMNGGVVSNLVVTNEGTGYTSTPTVSIARPVNCPVADTATCIRATAQFVLSPNTTLGTSNTITSGGGGGGTPPIVAQSCNGSRVPPENGGRGYEVPAGRSETTGLSPVFTISNITPAATVDEGQNWINLSYGPLSLYSASEQAMVGNARVGTPLGSYSIRPGSAAVNGGSATGAPNHDFYGNARGAGSGNGGIDIGAVELTPQSSAAAVVTPATLGFAPRVIGTTSPTQTLTLSNLGGAPLTISSIVVTAPFARAGGSCAAALAAGASCTITVTFTPTASDQASGTATIIASVAVLNSPVSLSGAGLPPPPADLSVTKVDNRGGSSITATQGSVSRGQSVTYTIVVTNAGPNPVTAAPLTDTLPGGTRFTVSGGGWTCTATAGSSCTATGTGNTTRSGTVTLIVGGSATYTLNGTVPAAAPGGASNNTVTVAVPAGMSEPNTTNNSATDTDQVGVPGVTLAGCGASGTATCAGGGGGGSFNFGNSQVGVTSAPHPFTYTNTGNVPVTVSAVTLSGGNADGNYALVSNTCTGVVNAGANCTFGVTLTPSVTGSRTRTLTVTATSGFGAVATQTASLTGTGVQAAAGFSWPNGGTVGAWGNASGTRTITVTNTGTAGSSLALTAVPAVANVTGTQFARTGGTCSASSVLAAGGSCTVTVSRTRPAAGAVSGTLTVSDTGAAAATQTLNMTGT